jgi:hypothetical protein
LRRIYTEDWETGMGSWVADTRDVADPTTFDTPNWSVVDSLPDDREGAAAFAPDLVIGDCATDTEAGVLFLESPIISIPAGADVPRVAFDHWVATELLWDGGNVKISVNGGPWELVYSDLFDFNAYPGWLAPSDNPMAGEEAFTGTDGGGIAGSWGQSQVNLAGVASPGDSIQLRFEMGLDGCNGVYGWYVDEVQAYYCCPTFGDVECDGSVGLDDYALFSDCAFGPETTPDPPSPFTATSCLDSFDSDADTDIDLADFARLQRTFGGQ